MGFVTRKEKHTGLFGMIVSRWETGGKYFGLGLDQSPDEKFNLPVARGASNGLR